MPDEKGTETTRSDVPSVHDSLFGDAPNDKPAAVAEPHEDSRGETTQYGQGSDDGGEQADVGESAILEDLKVIVSIKGGRATIGVQRPSADPHIETFDADDLSRLAQEVPAVTERARVWWEETPKHPAYERPAAQARRRDRRQQGTAQAEAGEGEAEQQQQQTLRLF